MVQELREKMVAKGVAFKITVKNEARIINLEPQGPYHSSAAAELPALLRRCSAAHPQAPLVHSWHSQQSFEIKIDNGYLPCHKQST